MEADQVNITPERILPFIRNSGDVAALLPEKIPALCEEIRTELINRTQENGGHLASNLGVVELTVAMHRVFDAEKDHFIFDVGHQSYVHKLLTGRYADFATLRQPGGLSGFPKRSESATDAFGTGHASTSLSAALGFAQADRLAGRDDYTVVLLGDGALTGGMIHEALNNCQKKLRLIVILNENEMSISKNVGHFARNLARLRAKPGYFRTKTCLERSLDHLPLLGKPLMRGLRRMKRFLKNHLYGSNYFENMGLSYFGPADGNDEVTVENLLRMAREKGSSCLIHLKTVKGRGFEPAEKSPDAYHCLPPQNQTATAPTFSDAFGAALCELAEKDTRVCAITAAMRRGTGLSDFAERFGERFFDVGIAEEHAVTFAAGLAAGGQKPVVAIYSSFLQRAYDQILHDVALQHLPVVFCIDRAGLNAADGATHHGIFDVAFLSQAPGMEIFEPIGYASLREILSYSLADHGDDPHPIAIRYPAGEQNVSLVRAFSGDGSYEFCHGVRADFSPATPPHALIVTYGRIAETALLAKEKCPDASIGILLMERLRPFDDFSSRLAAACGNGVRKLIFLEEGIRDGGLEVSLARAVEERLPSGKMPDVKILAIGDDFPKTNYGNDVCTAPGIGFEDLLSAIK